MVMDETVMVKYFPNLNHQERLNVYEFMHCHDQNDPVLINQSKQRLLLMIKNIAYHFETSEKNASDRHLSRNKLLNLAGLWQLIPIQELSEYMSTLREHGSQTHFEDNEYPVSELSSLPASFQLLSIANRHSFLSILEKNVSTIVFLNDLKNIQTSEYLSATNEPLTRTVFLNNLTKEEGAERDSFSICFDLIIQTFFLDCFHYQSEKYSHRSSERYARVKTHRIFSTICRQLKKGEGLASPLNELIPLDVEAFAFLDRLLDQNKQRMSLLKKMDSRRFD